MHIKIDLKIFLFIILFLVMKKIELYAMLMVFGFIHELCHLICGTLVGMKPDKIEVLPYGFKLSFKINYEDYNKKIKKGTLLSLKKILIYMSGPLINIAIAIHIILVAENIGINEITKLELVYSNMFIALFNLIPIYPIDGGKIIFEILHIFLGIKESYTVIQKITWVTLILLTISSSIIILYYRNIGIFIANIYLWGLVLKTQRYLELKKQVFSKLNVT